MSAKSRPKATSSLASTAPPATALQGGRFSDPAGMQLDDEALARQLEAELNAGELIGERTRAVRAGSAVPSSRIESRFTARRSCDCVLSRGDETQK